MEHLPVKIPPGATTAGRAVLRFFRLAGPVAGALAIFADAESDAVLEYQHTRITDEYLHFFHDAARLLENILIAIQPLGTMGNAGIDTLYRLLNQLHNQLANLAGDNLLEGALGLIVGVERVLVDNAGLIREHLPALIPEARVIQEAGQPLPNWSTTGIFHNYFSFIQEHLLPAMKARVWEQQAGDKMSQDQLNALAGNNY